MSRTASRALLPIAAVAVMFAAADTYVVVLSLPSMMTSVGLSIDQLQRAAPIISGFLLGYVAMLPLVGRIADLRGRPPVLIFSLVTFALGSLITAAAYDLGSLVAGRFLQGVGGGGLVPVTLALVADLYPAERRGVPLGIVGAVQELGSVLGPLYSAVVLVVGTWRDIFWINLTVALVLAGVVAVLARSAPAEASPADRARDGSRQGAGGPRRLPDLVGLVLLAVWLAGLLLVMRQPQSLVTSVRWGGPFVPFGSSTQVWWSPLGLVTVAVFVVLLAWSVFARRPLLDVRRWLASVREADLLGALLLATALGGVIVAFATADPEVHVLSAQAPWYLGVAALATVALVVHLRRARAPIIPRGAVREAPAWGSLVVSFFVGASMIAALVDIPIFARLTIYADSQVKAALVLVELLVAIPVGAVVGGLLIRRVPTGAVAAVGMVLAAVANLLMSRWGLESLHQLSSSVTLVVGGLGFGLALAPVNAALLSSTANAVHGVASALLVVARMVGMLIGISALTTIGLRRYYAVEVRIPAPSRVCGGGSTNCARYDHLLKLAGIEQLHAIFLGAAVAALIAAACAVLLLRAAGTGPPPPHPPGNPPHPARRR